MTHAPFLGPPQQPPSPGPLMDRLRLAFAIGGAAIGVAVTAGKGVLMFRSHLKERREEAKKAAEEARIARIAEIDARVAETIEPLLDKALQPVRESQQQIMLAATEDRATWQQRHEENIERFATLKTEVEGLKERRRWPREGS